MIGGPAVGGLLYAVSPVLVYALCCTLYLMSSVLISLVTAERIATSREPLSLAVLFAGFRYMRHNPVVLGVISLDLFAVVLGGMYALLPVFARDVFHAGPWGLGLLRASPGVGALMAALMLTHRPPRRMGRADHVRRGRRSMGCDHHLRAVELVPAVDGAAGGARRCRHDQRRHPHDA